MKIRYATINDAKLLAEIGLKTFSDTFAKDNKPEDMSLYLQNAFSPSIQLDELNNPAIIFLIAELDGNAVGYVKLNANSKSENITTPVPMEIERLYSCKEYIGKGVGAALMQASIKEAKERGFNSLWLGVWERNEVAISFYKKWGFKEVGNHLFMLGNDPQTDLIMQLLLG